jgi:hypothetical protein
MKPGLAIDKLLRSGVDEPWLRYESGMRTGKVPWRSAGLVKNQVDSGGRVVLEALAHQTYGGLVVRVFEEDPFKLHYAKRAEEPTVIDRILSEAAAVFEQLDGEPTEDLASESKEILGMDMADLLNPIPPPFSMDEIPIAESGRGDGIAPVTPPTPPGMRVRTGRFQ